MRETESKEFMEKTEEFAKKIIRLAVEEGLTAKELCRAVDTARWISENSMVDIESIEKTDFPSRHIVELATSVFDVTDH